MFIPQVYNTLFMIDFFLYSCAIPSTLITLGYLPMNPNKPLWDGSDSNWLGACLHLPQADWLLMYGEIPPPNIPNAPALGGDRRQSCKKYNKLLRPTGAESEGKKIIFVEAQKGQVVFTWPESRVLPNWTKNKCLDALNSNLLINKNILRVYGQRVHAERGTRNTAYTATPTSSVRFPQTGWGYQFFCLATRLQGSFRSMRQLSCVPLISCLSIQPSFESFIPLRI